MPRPLTFLEDSNASNSDCDRTSHRDRNRPAVDRLATGGEISWCSESEGDCREPREPQLRLRSSTADTPRRRPQHRPAHRRIPPEKRFVQEDRRVDECERHWGKKLP